jgi:hypothetical protein
MPSNINHWWTTRPKRKLITLVDVLRVFLAVAEGKQWSRNRDLHREFENALEENGLKGEGDRRDGQAGGARTYAAWLLSFGLWFEDSSSLVRPTFAGEDLVKGVAPVPIITEQLLNFQYPSPFSQKTRVNLRFRIFPFRFILKLLLQPKLNGMLSKAEIARFVITKAETDKDLNSVVESITAYRNSNEDDSIFDDSFVQTYGNITKLEDTANTFINQLEYTQLIGRIDGESKVFILDSQKSEVVKLLSKPNSLITRIDGEYEFFQRKYGLGLHHKRDDRKFSTVSNVSASQAEKSKVLLALSDILANQPIKSISKDILNRISEKTGVELRSVERIITSVGVQPSYDIFEEKYLQLSMSGRSFATEFEQATEGIFGVEGFGFDTKWIGSKPNNPDILAISANKGNEYLGILDTKAYKQYSIDGNHQRVMTQVYIPKYTKYNHNGINVELDFFSYIAGGFKSTIDKGIDIIYKQTAIKGFAITAQELLLLLQKHRKSPISKQEFKRLFTLNRQILPTDFNP